MRVPYYIDKSVTIFHGDNREILPEIESVDHLVSDPPYSETTHVGARTHGDGRGDMAGQGGASLVDFDQTDVSAIRTVLAACQVRRWGILTVDWQHVLPLKLQPPLGWKFIRHGVWVKP